MYIDHSVFPDIDNPPTELTKAEDKADYIQRVCAAWDFYIHPEPETFALFSSWRHIFDQFPIVTSPAYHAFRYWFGWPPIAAPENMYVPPPQWVHLDQLAGREADPCEEMI